LFKGHEVATLGSDSLFMLLWFAHSVIALSGFALQLISTAGHM
jgi:hypothetical protein